MIEVMGISRDLEPTEENIIRIVGSEFHTKDVTVIGELPNSGQIPYTWTSGPAILVNPSQLDSSKRYRYDMRVTIYGIGRMCPQRNPHVISIY